MDSLKNLNQIEEEDDDDEEDDEDYVPSKEDLENDDDIDKGDDEDDSSDSDADDDGDSSMQTKKNKKRGRKRKLSTKDNAENVSEEGRKELTSEEKKKKADDLWAELNDTSSNKIESKPETKPSSEIKVEEKVYDFAGETVIIKEPTKTTSVTSSSSSSSAQPTNSRIPVLRKSGLQDLVSNLGKKSKLGTLQKSKIDWDSFKREKGIEDELKQATLSKDGFVERQAFLSRADMRQFEIEKSIRSQIRKPQ